MVVLHEALTGREIKLLDSDRSYRFISLGSFADKPSMRYVMTSNDDKVIVYLNFRSEMHVRYVRKWLQTGRGQGDWTRSTQMESTVTSGIPNGPYSGPVFFKAVSDGLLDLRGSDCGEGTYFVFIDTEPDLSGGDRGSSAATMANSGDASGDAYYNGAQNMGSAIRSDRQLLREQLTPDARGLVVPPACLDVDCR
ncbi:hypothetical protein AK812_SmicGene46709, partial [Symbiodinium microadriaticum]